MSKLTVTRNILTMLIISINILLSTVNVFYIVKDYVKEVQAATIEDVQTTQSEQDVQETTLPACEDDIEKMSVTDKLLFLILMMLCVFFGAFIGYVVVDRLR